MKRLLFFFVLLYSGTITAQNDSLINELRRVGMRIEEHPRLAPLYLQRAELLEQLGLDGSISQDLMHYKYVNGDTNNIDFLRLRKAYPYFFVIALPMLTAKSDFITGTWTCDSITSKQYDETGMIWQSLSDTTQHITYTIRYNGEMLIDAPNGKQTGNWALFNDKLVFYSDGKLQLFSLRGKDKNLMTLDRPKYNAAGLRTYSEYLHLQRK